MVEVPATELLLKFLRKMLLIRRVNEQIIAFSAQGLLPGSYYVHTGQEATAVGVLENLGPNDYVFSTHRNNGHVIGKGGLPGPVLAEALGKLDGYAGGRGGTHHLNSPDLGILHTSAIVGGNVPLATGAALSIKRLGRKDVSLVFFGTAAMEEGAFYEAANIAALWKLPVIFVCENNDVPVSQRSADQLVSPTNSARRLSDIPRAFGIPSKVIDATDILTIYQVAKESVSRIRENGEPYFLEMRTTPWPLSKTVPRLLYGEYQIKWAWDPDSVPLEIRDWTRFSDPISILILKLIDAGVNQKQIHEIDTSVKDEMKPALQFAMTSPSPTAEMTFQNIFA